MLKDLSCIKVVEGNCLDCFYKTPCNHHRESLIGSLFGVAWCKDIIPNGYIFKKEDPWQVCTKDNTMVGDTVCDNCGGTYVVKYIHESREDFLVGDQFDCDKMMFFKIKVG